MPLSVLSFASIIGIFSLTAIIGIIVFDGFTKLDSPGSLWNPAATSLGIDNYHELGIAFGLFMAGVRIVPLLSPHVSCSSPYLLVCGPRGDSDPGEGYGRPLAV